MRVYFVKIKGQVTVYTVQYETTIEDRYVVVLRYDNAHGTPHRDTVNRHGGLESKEWFPEITNNEALTRAITDIQDNWRVHRRRFMGE